MSLRFALAAVLFILSGALGLGYELVWVRKAALIVGATQIALATVLTSFFLGLGLGSLTVGRYLRGRRRSPLFVYGLFEAGIGLFAVAFPFLFRLLDLAYGAIYPLAGGSAAALLLVRFGLLFLLFLPPTFLMGGTLPLLLDGLIERDRAVGSLTSLLYGLNVLGAVAGVLVTGYLAIPRLGMNGSSLIFGGGNLLVAAIALVAFRRTRPLHAAGPGAAARLPAFFAAMAAASGFAAIGYQIAWARYFSLFHAASVHRTAVLLAVYLLALALGSLVLAPILTSRARPLRVVAVAQALVPPLVFGCLEWWRFARHTFAYAGAPGTGEVRASWVLLGETPDALLVAPLLQTALVLLLPVALLGTGLPALIAAATRTSRELRSRAGTLVFWNTIGSSAGGFAAGYLLIPRLGLGGTFAALALVTLALAVAAEWQLGRAAAPGEGASRWRRLARPGWALSALALFFLVFFFYARGDLARRTIERYGQAGRGESPELIDLVEGPLTTAHVLRSQESLYLVSGDVVMAAVDYTGPSTQALQGHVPVLFYPGEGAPKDCLGLALGSGQSFGALLMYPVERLDVVDISPEIVELSFRHFGPYNHGLSADERVRLWIDDGRHFVDRAPPDHYDVVTMEPPPPTAEGVFPLYSLEFYGGVARVLREGGVFMQWLPLYMITPNDLRGIVRTQAELFPHTFVVRAGSYDFVVLSFKGPAPPRFRPEWIAERGETYGRERLVAQSRWLGGRYLSASPMGIVSSIITGPDDVARIDAPLLFHDDDQALSYSSGDREILRRYEGHDRTLVARLSFAALPLTPFAELARYFDGPIPVDELELERALTLDHFGVAPPGVLEAAIQRHREAADPALRAHWALVAARIHDRRLDKPGALEWIGRALESGPAAPAPEDVAATREIARNQIATFAPLLGRWLDSLPAGLRGAPLAEAVAEELAAHRAR